MSDDGGSLVDKRAESTGMVEVDNIRGLLKIMKDYAAGPRVGFIADDTLTNRKVVQYAKKLFDIDMVSGFYNDFEDWKKAYIDIQTKCDSLIFYNFIGIVPQQNGTAHV